MRMLPRAAWAGSESRCRGQTVSLKPARSYTRLRRGSSNALPRVLPAARRATESGQGSRPLQRLLRSRRPDSNRGPLHYEGKTSRGRASTLGHTRALFPRRLGDFSALAVDGRARLSPSRRTLFVPGRTRCTSGREGPLLEIGQQVVEVAASCLKNATTKLHQQRAVIGEPVRARLEKTAIRPEAVTRGEDSVRGLGAQIGIVNLKAKTLRQVRQGR